MCSEIFIITIILLLVMNPHSVEPGASKQGLWMHIRE